MKRLHLGPIPYGADLETKVNWLLKAMHHVELASQDQDASTTAQSYTLSNVSENRTLDASTISAADLADVVGTYLQDLTKRGQKRTL